VKDHASILRQQPRWVVIATALGISVGLALAGWVIESRPSVTHFALIVEPVGTSWLLTPPSTWCNVTRSSSGIAFSCSMAGAASVALNVTSPSRLSGGLEIGGPSSLWLFPTVWSCDIEGQLTGVPLPCPVPYNPPPWSTWVESFASAGTINLSALQLNVSSAEGVLPPADWSLILVDRLATNERATVTAPVVLSNP
jgi:hypothetical protein